MTNVFDVANYILQISREESEEDEYELISHMKLQKLVYFCQGFSLALLDKPLFEDPIEAWTHGPVCPKLYHLLKGYGASPVTSIIDPENINLSEKEKLLVKMVYNYYGQFSASKLRRITHEEGPWKDTPPNSTISRESTAKYFESRIEVKPEDIPPITDDEKQKISVILEEMDADGELSQFCN